MSSRLIFRKLFHCIPVLLVCLIVSQLAFSQPRHFPRGTHDVFIAKTKSVRTELLGRIAPIIEKSINNGEYPGAVVLVAHNGQIIYRGVWGNRRILPNAAPMRFNTLFDIASLTKVVATTPAVMQLVEQGRIDLDAAAAKYWPTFASKGKSTITIRQLLTHMSGLPAEVYPKPSLSSKKEILQQVTELNLKSKPGSAFLYSDVNFIVLAHIIEKISGERIDQYARKHIFKPLKMNDTFFAPSARLRDRIAPTEKTSQSLRWGKVHDPVAYAMGGIAGNAGLFSTAHDLGLYAQSLLNGGKLQSTYFLGPLAISKMTTPQTPEKITEVRGLGWDIDSAFSNRGVLFPMQSFGHSGWTGTSLWIDPATQTWIIILTSRAHPTPAKHNQLVQDRRKIANIVSASLVDLKISRLNNTGKGEIKRAFN